MTWFRPHSLAQIAAGFAVWTIGFAAVYGLQGFGCARGWDQIFVGPTTIMRALLLGFVVATVVAIAALAFRLKRHDLPDGADAPGVFLRSVATNTALAATAAAAVTFAGVATLSMCN